MAALWGCSIKLLMGTDGPNLKETAKLYDQTEAEQELLLARKRDHAMFMVVSSLIFKRYKYYFFFFNNLYTQYITNDNVDNTRRPIIIPININTSPPNGKTMNYVQHTPLEHLLIIKLCLQ